MRELAAGETPPAIKLRPGDYWTEFAENLNTVMDRLRQPSPPSQPAYSAAHAVPSTMFDVATIEPEADTSRLAPATPLATPIILPLDSLSTAQNIYSDLSI